MSTATEKDTRVQKETRRATNTSFTRDMESIVVLYSYTTPVAVHDTTEDVLYVSGRVYDNDHPEQFSHTTKCHVGRFRTHLELARDDDIFVDHDDLEISVIRFDLERKLAAKSGVEVPDWSAPSVLEIVDEDNENDDVPTTEQLSVGAEIVEEALERATGGSGESTVVQVGGIRVEIPAGSSVTLRA